jgi:hypothetical protein
MAVEKVLPQVRVCTSDVHLDLLHYQFRVLETALPPARSLRYQVPALLSEMGELYGVLAKEVRDAKGAPNYPARQAELGDVAYLTALTLNDLGVRAVSSSYERKVSEIGLGTALRAVEAPYCPGVVFGPAQVACMKFLTPKVSKPSSARATFAGHLQRLWCSLPYLAEVLLVGSPEYVSRRAAARTDVGVARLRESIWQDVLAANVAKLADRANRGVIEGNGDYR